MNPRLLFRRVAIAEAVTWTLLLVGMFLKYVTETTEVGVQVGGMLHGVVFVAFCVTTVVVAVDRRWSVGRTLLGLGSAVVPLCTVPFDRRAEARGWLADSWRLAVGPPERGSGPAGRVAAPQPGPRGVCRAGRGGRPDRRGPAGGSASRRLRHGERASRPTAPQRLASLSAAQDAGFITPETGSPASFCQALTALWVRRSKVPVGRRWRPE